MATQQKITRDNFGPLLVRSTTDRDSTPTGNVYFDTTNDKIQLITADESANVTYPSGHAGYTDGNPETNPLTTTDKVQALALYFFALQEVEADPALQNFRVSLDAVSNRMGKLVGATAFLNTITLDVNVTTANTHDQDKVADSGFTEFNVDGSIQRVLHGVRSLGGINSTTQPYGLLAASSAEADRLAAIPFDFPDTGDINAVVESYLNGGDDNRNSILITCAREFGYTIGEATSVEAGVAELGAYSAGYGVGNAIAPDIDALNYDDVWTTPIAPYDALTFYRHASAQNRTGFSSSGAGTSGDFTDEVQLSAGTMSIIELRAWLDALMLQDTDENANTGSTGPLQPKRMEPLYTIDGATAKLVTRAGVYVDPSKLTAEAQQQIIIVDDSAGLHYIPFNSGLTIIVSDAWLADTNPWWRVMYEDASGTNDFDTSDAITVLDASASAMSGDDTDGRITGNAINLSYAYDTETAGGNVTAGVPQNCILQIGGTDNSKTRTIPFTISRSAAITVPAETAEETN